MNRILRAIIGAVLILIIAFSAISICQSLGRRWKLDITEQKLFTLSPGTKAILSRLNQPIRARLYYAKTAAMHGNDQIRYFNNYYEYVKSLLEEYVVASKGMVQLDVIDPRPFSDEEEAALKAGLQRFAVTESEGFFFGLVIETQFGVEKTIPVFSPDRQTFVEYDISYLIDTAMTRQKKRIGVMSSLPVMGQEVGDYMAEMMARQGQQPTPPWTIVKQLREKYEVKSVPTDVNDINDVDILLVIHPKALPQQTQFAIDQFVLKGGRTIVCVDPYSVADRPQRNPMQMSAETQSSDLGTLLRTWGLDMPANTFAGDTALMLKASLNANQAPEEIIGFLEMKPPECFNKDNAISARLNQVRMLFPGVLKEVAASVKPSDPNAPQPKAEDTPKIVRTPLITTTAKGNSWSVGSSFELMFPDAGKLLAKFVPGNKPVVMGFLVAGRLKSAFPEGIEVEEKAKAEENDPNTPKAAKKHITGMKEASADCAVAVFSDVDFLWDPLAYVSYGIFGKAPAGDNAALLLNTVEVLGGSGDLISIRSRGSYRRPFTVVDEIEQKAEQATAAKVELINAQIAGFNKELQDLVSSKDSQAQDVFGSTIIQKKRALELNIHNAQRQLRAVRAKSLEEKEQLGNSLRRLDMLAVPSVIMVVALGLGIWRSMRKRHYISHASDA
jgi:ABC-2 type transport system permease protein